MAEQPVGVLGLADDLDAGIAEQADDAFARQHDVVGYDYAHGISARTLVGPTSSEPSSAPMRSARWSN